MYIALQKDMEDLSVGQAEAPGEAINYCDEEYSHFYSSLEEKLLSPVILSNLHTYLEDQRICCILFHTGVMLFVREAEPVSQPTLWTSSGGICNKDQSCSSSSFPGTHWL